MSHTILSSAKFYEGYSRINVETGAYETWNEAVTRVMNMHRQHYKEKVNPELTELINFSENKYKEKLMLGAQRALQFGGAQLLKHQIRMYNCVSSYVDRTTFFGECMYMLLCGAGAGFSVQKHHIIKLPTVTKPSTDTVVYTIPDSIEGWADAVQVLMSSYFTKDQVFPEYFNKKIVFDYSLIRPKGAFISGGFKAPGAGPLRQSLERIEALMNDVVENGTTNLRPIQAYDVVMHISDAVISGGVRRSACICMFSYDDNEMVKAKTGNWFVTNPQRARSNNSAILLRNKITKEEFHDLMQSVKEFGEPGFIFSDSTEFTYNPCQPAFAPILTPNGLSTMGDIKEGDLIWSKSGWTTVIKKWSTGFKDVYNYKTTFGAVPCTENHRLVSNGIKIEAKDCSSIDVLAGNYTEVKIDPSIVMDGLVIGDGSIHKASKIGNQKLLYIGNDDQDYFTSEVSEFIRDLRWSKAHSITTNISESELTLITDREIPSRYVYSDINTQASFLRGLFSANGSVTCKRVTLKATSFKIIKDAQLMLSALGIRSYFTTNKPAICKHKNGVYTSKKSYDLNISTDIDKFSKLIGFIQIYKNNKLKSVLANKQGKLERKSGSKIISNEFLGNFEVFDITVDNEEHTYWSGGHNISNCVEIGKLPITAKGISGWQGCNLNEINGGACTTEEIFYDACKAAAILGTLQAGYTDFKYLAKESMEIFRREALLGVSVTGWMNNPDILFDKEVMRKGAEIVKATNKIVAKLIGINPAARTTCVKPSGNASVLLGTASGIHGEHAPRYLRNVQMNKESEVVKLIKETNPLMVEESVWSATGSDYIISFPLESKTGSVYKNDLLGVKQLEYVKLAQQNWIEYGTDTELCTDSRIRHNVSNTIVVDDWDAVEKYVFDNRKYFAGISFLGMAGDKDYNQAPFTTVLTAAEILNKYGDASMFASGLLVEGLDAFNQNLWLACDTVMGFGLDLTNQNHENMLQRDFVDRAVKFAHKYFKDNLQEMSYCLKDVYLLHKWNKITMNQNEINWIDNLQPKDFVEVDTLGAIACSGGACELTF